MWILRRMKKLGLDTSTLLNYYVKEIRVHLELAVPVWHSGLTRKLTANIERVQRIAVHIITGNSIYPYNLLCQQLGLKSLQNRRLELCQRFAAKTAKQGRHTELFQIEKGGVHNTRSNSNKFREHNCRKTRFYNSPLPYLTRILNK